MSNQLGPKNTLELNETGSQLPEGPPIEETPPPPSGLVASDYSAHWPDGVADELRVLQEKANTIANMTIELHSKIVALQEKLEAVRRNPGELAK